MFYFDKINNLKILRSDMLTEADAFFTTREIDSYEKINPDCNYIMPCQTHSDNVEIVDERLDYPNTDGLILYNKKVAICLKFADCTPLIFYDTEHAIGAVSHAGWRGTASKIGIKTIEKMKSNFGTNPQNVKVLIGPSISLCCYEVGEDVKNKLLSTVKNTDGLYKDNFVDLKQINARQLEEIGVEQIDTAPFCTYCRNDLFFSYRKENGTKDRHYAILKL